MIYRIDWVENVVIYIDRSINYGLFMGLYLVFFINK